MADRKPNGQFVKGRSGNQAGRPPGSGSSPGVLLRKEIAKHGKSLLNQLINDAKAGNTEAATWLLDRIIPRLKAQAAPVEVDTTGSVSELTQRLLRAVGDGRMAVDEAIEVAKLAASQPVSDSSQNQVNRERLDELYRQKMAQMAANQAAIAGRAERLLRAEVD